MPSAAHPYVFTDYLAEPDAYPEDPFFPGLSDAGTVLISLGIYFAGPGSAAAYSMYYCWVVLAACWFLTSCTRLPNAMRFSMIARAASVCVHVTLTA